MTQTARRGRVYRRCTTCANDIAGTGHEGCPGKRSTWTYVVDLAGPGEPRQQKRKAGFATKGEAVAALSKLQSSKADGTYVQASRQTVEQYLTEWLQAVKPEYAPGTHDAAKLHVEAYIVPRIGSKRLQALTTTDVKAMLADIGENGRQRSDKPLSPKMVHNIFTTLCRALNDAVAERPPRIFVNPAAKAHKAPPSPEQETWTVAQLRAFYAFAADHRLYAMWRLAASTGLRRGELVGLRWRDVNLDAGLLAVAQQRAKGHDGIVARQTKGKRGRPVPIDDVTVAGLRRHRSRQAEERLAWGAAWRDTGLVFVHEDGSPLHPDTATKAFKRLVADAGLPWIKLHGLRHTHATLMLEAGVHPKVVQERLGHSSISITLDTYSHVSPTMQQEAAAKVAAIVDGGLTNG